jgi:hypothetical protein
VPSKKQLIRIVLPVILVLLFFFQIKKRNSQIAIFEKRETALKLTNSPFSKVLFQLPIYRDSVYRIYITKINKINKLVFLAKGNVTEKQRESSFFVHIYPKNKKKLTEGINHIPYNFKNNVTSFLYNNEMYFVSQTNLPDLKISKLNLGQFGFRGDNNISWHVSDLLTEEKIGKILKENKEGIKLFELIGDSF